MLSKETSNTFNLDDLKDVPEGTIIAQVPRNKLFLKLTSKKDRFGNAQYRFYWVKTVDYDMSGQGWPPEFAGSWFHYNQHTKQVVIENGEILFRAGPTSEELWE